nr:alpha/beta hydrolase [uncultured Celeribacter sp.]
MTPSGSSQSVLPVKRSEFRATLSSALSREQAAALPADDDLLLRTPADTPIDRFAHRQFARSSFPVNLYDAAGVRRIDGFLGDGHTAFPQEMRMPQSSSSGCAFVVKDDTLFVLYDRLERWEDVPDALALVAVRLDRDRFGSLMPEAPDPQSLTQSEYLLLSHMLAGLDLRAAAAVMGASYDTKRKQIQTVMEKLGARNQAALLRALALDITARVLDEILPKEHQSYETSLVKRQFGKDVVISKITIGEGVEVPVWDFGARRGRPVLYFHNMLAPTVFDRDIIAELKRNNLRWIVIPRHFLNFAGVLGAQARVEKLTAALAETLAYLSDDPVVCIGESAGVPWAVNFARRFPHQVSHLVLSATPKPPDTGPVAKDPSLYEEMSQRLRRDERVLSGLTRIYNAIARMPSLAQRGLLHMYRHSPADTLFLERTFRQGYLSEWLRVIANEGTLASIDELMNLQRNWEDELTQVGCDITFVHGAEDPVCPAEAMAHMVGHLPNAQCEIVEDAGHFVLMQHFPRFASLSRSLSEAA